MQILKPYDSNTLQLITSDEQELEYSLVNFNSDIHKIKLSVFTDFGQYISESDLEINTDFYINDNQLFLKPNEYLDRAGLNEANYNLQFDFITRFRENNELYISEVSPSRREIRLTVDTNIHSDGMNENYINEITTWLNDGDENNEYQFNSFLELNKGRLIPINGYAVDRVTDNKITFILKLNQPVPSDVNTLQSNFYISNKFLSSQTETVFFIDEEELAVSGLGLEIDTGYSVEDNFEQDLNYTNYNSLTGSFGQNVFDQVGRLRKDINLNVDYSKFKNYTFFGSAESKLKNFKDKAVKLEGLYSKISSSLAFSSSKNIIAYRKDLFKQAKDIQDNFTYYEYFLYNDGQSYSSASAPGVGTNLAGTDFSNKYSRLGNNFVTSSRDSEGFDTVHTKHTDGNNDYNHLFTDVYRVEDPPFYNTNKAVYLSFVMRGHTGSVASPNSNFDLTHDGGNANIHYDMHLKDYPYNRYRRIPYEAFSGSALLNPTATGSHYQRYIFKAEQLFWRPKFKHSDNSHIIFSSELDTVWSGSSGTYYEILSGSNVISASTSGSIGTGFAYGIKDQTGQYKPYFFPDKGFQANNTPSEAITGSVMSQGDLFPLFLNDNSKPSKAFFTDVVVTYNNPTDIHPFSKIYRPPSGSYAGSTKWNDWYDGSITSASNYDNDNIHSLVNNLPFALRTDAQHETLRNFVNMLGEQFDLLRSYIDNYQNFYKMGYKNPNSIPDNLLSIMGDSVGWDLFNPFSGSITSYLDNNQVDGIGINTAINSLWKKILNNVIYIYKTKGTQESLGALLNLYGFDATSFKLQEYGGSIEEHNPTILNNSGSDLLNGLTNTAGNVSFISETVPFPMLNLDGSSNYLGLDWWVNNAKPNGIEFVFNANQSENTQTLLRASGSNDLWDVRIIPSGSSTTTGSIEFRLNYEQNASSAIGTNHVSMSTGYIDGIMSDQIFNIMLQRSVVTGSNTLGASSVTQSYHMFVARKDNDMIKDVHFISMSSHNSSISASYKSGSFINQNFVQTSSLSTKNLFMGETLSGSVAEVRAWSSYVSMSKFKQHVLNYHSLVGGSVTSGVDDVIYRFRLNENIPNWNRHPDSASLKIYDSNPQHTQDYSHFITSQPTESGSLNFRTFMTEQTFYRFGVRGTDEVKNDNQINLQPKLYAQDQLSPDNKTLVQPKVDGVPTRQFSNKIGKSFSYVNAIDSLVINLMSDFKLDDYLEDGTMDGVYSDLVDLRKKLISNNEIQINVVENLKSVESVFNNPIVDNLTKILPGRTKFEFAYDVKNDVLFRSKIKRARLQSQLNPNFIVGGLGSSSFLEPTLSSTANENFKNGTIDISDNELSTTGFANHNFKNGTVDVLDNELSVSSLFNENVKTNHSAPLDIVDLSKSKRESVYTANTSNFTNLLLGSKNEFYKNHGKGDNQVYFKSSNVGANGDYNTYKYESRFTFPTIGDTEEFHPVSGTYKIRTGTNARQPYNHHDNFRHFHNRQFIDSGSYTYTSFFAAHAEPGRMIGRTRFFRTDSDGNITYPSNHFINMGTSKDVLNNLIYKGTQYDGSYPTTDPLGLDTQRTVPAYTTEVGGSDTLRRLTVNR